MIEFMEQTLITLTQMEYDDEHHEIIISEEIDAYPFYL